MTRAPIHRDAAGVMVVVLGASAWLVGGWGGERVTTAVTDLGSLGAALIAAGACALAASRKDDDRTAWLSMATACLLWGLGEAMWSWDELVVQNDIPFPSVADAAYLAAVPVALVALLHFSRGTGRNRMMRTLLDGALVAGSLLFVLWAVLLEPIWNGGDDSSLAQAVNLAYPVTDLAMVTVALLIVQWGNVRHRLAMLLLAMSLLLMALTDLSFTYLTNNGSYSSTDVISVGWIAAYLLIALGARAPKDARLTDDHGPDVLEPLASMLIPYVALGFAAAVAIGRLIDGRDLDVFLQVNIAVLILVLLVRQAVSLRDNRRLVVRLHDAIDSLNAREAELEHLAWHDGLTGLANRSRLVAKANEVLTSQSMPAALIYIDLDGFKAVNDALGHSTGDLLLIQAAERLSTCIRADDLLARVGGDEFVVLLRGGPDAATSCVRRIADEFTRGFLVDGEVASVSASMGIALAARGGSAEEAIREADAAMYAAKRRGKGRAVVYPDESLVI